MWHRLPADVIAGRDHSNEMKKSPPGFLYALIYTMIFIAALVAITYLDEALGLGTAKHQHGEAFSLKNASPLSLVLVFAATALFAYFLLVKNRPRQIVFICYDCQEAFHAAEKCPNCGSTNVSDIRFAEWRE